MESSLKTESPSQRLTPLPAPFGKGAFWAHGFQSLAKIKRLCPCKETKAQTSAVPLFLPGRKGPAAQKLPGNGGVRRGLLLFSPQLQGDFPCSLPSASHQTAALFASRGRVLVLFRAFFICIPYSIRFLRDCQEEKWTNSVIPSPDTGPTRRPGSPSAPGSAGRREPGGRPRGSPAGTARI